MVFLLASCHLVCQWRRTFTHCCTAAQNMMIMWFASLQAWSLMLLLLLAYLSYHEKATKRCTSSFRSCRPSVYHTKMGESGSVPFPTAQQVNLPVFSTLSLICWTSSREAVNTNFKVIGLTRLGIESWVYRSRSRRSIPLGHLIGSTPKQSYF